MSEQPSTAGAVTFADVLVDASKDALFVVSPDGTVLSWNRGAESLYGYTHGEAVGRPLFELLVPDSRRDEARRALQDAVDRGHARVESIRRRRDGALLSVEVELRRVDGRDDGPTIVAARETDITLLRRLRDRETNEASFRALLDAAPDAMVIVDADGRIQLVNHQAESLFGYAREQLLGQPVELLVPDRLRATHPAYRGGYVREPRPRPMGGHLKLSARRKDGTEFPAEISLSPMKAADRMLFTAAIRDVTERRRAAETMARAKEAAESANRELEAFSYSVAHDLRAPLRGIDGFSAALLEDYGDRLDEEGRAYLGKVRSSAQYMAQLIESLLMLAKVTQSEIERQPVDLSALARAAVSRLRMAEPDRVVTDVVEEGLVAQGDARLLGVVLDNLLGNAWKFTSRRASARVAFGATPADGGGVVYFVSDDGAGFDMAYAAKLFGVFQRLHSPDEFQGTGVGLATVQRILRRHGGSIWAQGQVGFGATFHFTLEKE